MLLATMAGRWYSLCVRGGLQKCRHALILIIGVFTIHSAVLSLEELLTHPERGKLVALFILQYDIFSPIYTRN